MHLILKLTFTKQFGNFLINPLNANPEKWSNTLKQIVGNLPTICLNVFDHFMNLALKGLNSFVEFFVVCCLFSCHFSFTVTVKFTSLFCLLRFIQNNKQNSLSQPSDIFKPKSCSQLALQSIDYCAAFTESR